MRDVPAYLWAVWKEVRESAGHFDIAIGIAYGLFLAVARTGTIPLPSEILVTIQDVATWTLLLFIAVQFLLIAPARLWSGRSKRDGGSPITFEAGSVKVESGGSFAVIVSPGQVPIFQPQDIPPLSRSDNDLADTTTVAGDEPSSPEGPQSPERSTHD